MLNQADITATIKSIPWFLELKPESIQHLAAITDVLSFQTDEIIFSEGEKHNYLYVVLEGKVCIESLIPGHGSLPIFTAESLDVVGWSSLTPVIRQKTGTAHVLAPTTLLAFEAGSLMKLCKVDRDLGFVIMCRVANVVASRLLTHRLQLLALIAQMDHQS